MFSNSPYVSAGFQYCINTGSMVQKPNKLRYFVKLKILVRKGAFGSGVLKFNLIMIKPHTFNL